jgi:hypothetical protein
MILGDLLLLGATSPALVFWRRHQLSIFAHLKRHAYVLNADADCMYSARRLSLPDACLLSPTGFSVFALRCSSACILLSGSKG